MFKKMIVTVSLNDFTYSDQYYHLSQFVIKQDDAIIDLQFSKYEVQRGQTSVTYTYDYKDLTTTPSIEVKPHRIQSVLNADWSFDAFLGNPQVTSIEFTTERFYVSLLPIAFEELNTNIPEMSYTVYHGNSHNKTEHGTFSSYQDAYDSIESYWDTKNFKPDYIRIWTNDTTAVHDYGSHYKFYMIEQTIRKG